MSATADHKMGQLIRLGREKLGMSEEQLAHELGRTRQLVSLMELGFYRFTKDWMLERIAQVLNINLGKLLSSRPTRRICRKKRRDPIGKLVTNKRAKLELTQPQLAQIAGVTLDSISVVERGIRPVRNRTISRILWALECEIPAKLLPQK